MRKTLVAFGAILLLSAARAPLADDVVMKTMKDELARTMERLRLDTLAPPYFIAYRVSEFTTANAAAQLGSLSRSSEGHGRVLNVELRVGDYAFDNTNFAGGPSAMMLGMFGNTSPLPLDDDYQEIRRRIWLTTDG